MYVTEGGCAVSLKFRRLATLSKYWCPINLIVHTNKPSEMYFKHISDGLLFSKLLMGNSNLNF